MPPSSKPSRPASIYVAETGTARGKGVYAARDFARGELVENCTVLPYRMSFDKLSHELQHCVFNWSEDDEPTPFHAHAQGFGSFYNHANPANLYYEKDRKNLQMRFFAVDALSSGTELTINYNAEDGGPTWDDDYWFEEMNIRRI